ncbi:ribonuclease R [Taylorella equigenitalis]|uniref:ribonuclease R n=1 Tax=Taylorella equigenitalis TaxID=29575 RepID=UPI00042226B6|nr:ribonuclease R [Taylorella equigenitalis]WDU54031.1 ribonuclease R [Taylorella equigenitalis]
MVSKKKISTPLDVPNSLALESGIQFDPDVPSREDILKFMREHKKQIGLDALSRHFNLTRESAIQGLAKRLSAMLRDTQLISVRQGYKINDNLDDLITGTVQGHRDGYGFLISDDSEEDIYLPEREMLKVLHGDIVTVRVVGDNRGRPEGAIFEVLERGTTKLVGRILHEQGQWVVVPEDTRIKHDIIIPNSDISKAKHGNVVVTEIVRQPTRYSQPLGKVIEVLGDIDDPGMEIEIAIRKFDVPVLFSDATQKLAKTFPKELRPSDYKDRVDLRDVPFITIDGEDARDFDDAVYAELVNIGSEKRKRMAWRLLVAIADVSHYVKPEDALDKDAQERGTSVYFPRRVIPMLPEVLSNGLCSLNPNVDRLVLVCDMIISESGAKAGEISAYQFYNAVIHSHARTTYTQVWDMIQNESGPNSQKFKHVRPHILDLYQLFNTLYKQRQDRGAIDFDTIETKIISNEMGKIEQIVPFIRNNAHKLIEECMLAANTCAADFIIAKKQQALFRIHEGPTTEKLQSLRDFLKNIGLTLEGGAEPESKHYAKMIELAKARPDFQVIQTLALRSMQQAIYSPDNVGHFGLAYDAYTHFTSPIRRYPDLLVHRVIKGILSKQKYSPKIEGYERVKGEPIKAYEHGVWERLGIQMSAMERRADEASKDVESWLKCWFIRERTGEIFSGKVSSVTSFGLFVTLDTLYVDGLIHISELGADFFQFNESTHELIGERTGKRYKLGDTVHVQVASVNLEARKIDFLPVKGLSYSNVQKELMGMEEGIATQKSFRKKAAKTKPQELKGMTSQQRRAKLKREQREELKKTNSKKSSRKRKR